MKAVDYLKAKGRMTGNCHILCRDCPLDNCNELEADYPEQAVEIVEKWAKENPAKTYLSTLLEKFPNATMGEDGCPKCCPTSLFNIEQECPKLPCDKCWSRECEEVE